MSDTPLQQLTAAGQSVWIDFLSRPFVQDGDLEALVARGRRRRDLQPDDLPGRDRRGRRLRRPAPRGARDRARDPKEIFLALAARRHPRRLRHPARRLGRDGEHATRRLGLARGRPEPRARHRGARSRRPSACTRSSTGRTCSSRSRRRSEGLPAIEETIAAGIPVNVTLIFSLERHREVAEAYVRGAPAARRRRRRPDADGVRRVVLRLARRHRGRQAPRRDRRPRRAQGHARDRQRQARLPDLQGGLLRRPQWEALARQGRDARSAACGRRRRRRTPTTATCIYVEELIGPDTVNTMPRETVEAFQDHGEVRGDTLDARTSTARAAIARRVRGRRDRLRRRRRDARARGRGEVRQVVPAAVRRRRGQARRRWWPA